MGLSSGNWDWPFALFILCQFFGKSTMTGGSGIKPMCFLYPAKYTSGFTVSFIAGHSVSHPFHSIGSCIGYYPADFMHYLLHFGRKPVIYSSTSFMFCRVWLKNAVKFLFRSAVRVVIPNTLNSTFQRIKHIDAGIRINSFNTINAFSLRLKLNPGRFYIHFCQFCASTLPMFGSSVSSFIDKMIAKSVIFIVTLSRFYFTFIHKIMFYCYWFYLDF